MKFVANTSFLAAVVATAVGPSSTDALKLSSATLEDPEFHTKISFKTDHDIVDTPESLAIFEQAVLMSAGETHDPSTYSLTGEKVESASHTRLQSRGAILGEVKAATKDSLRGAGAADDDFGDDLFWVYGNDYWNWNTYGKRRMASLMLGSTILGEEDDAESHKKWEDALCDILGQTEVYSGAYDCKIEFVEAMVNVAE